MNLLVVFLFLNEEKSYIRGKLTYMRLLFLFSIISSLFFSCVTHKKMLILQGDVSATQDSLQNRLINEYLLQPGDIVNIKVSSLDPESVAIFNKTVGGASGGNMMNPIALYLNGYMIDGFGAINLPLVGDVEVQGMTMDSLNKFLDEKLAGYFKHYTVDAKLVSYRVSVLGEVKTPGTQMVYNRDVNLLQVLSDAGGLTNFGNVKNVKVIRKAFNSNESVVLDLSKEDVIHNEYFYIMPHDVIYVEPYKAKAVSINAPFLSMLATATSLIILIINFTTK